jgi:integrase
MVETGARPDEICRLKLENINLVQGYLSIPNGKTKSARRKVASSARARAVIARRIATAR